MPKSREKAISILLDEGADMTEENITATMKTGSNDDDVMVADAVIKSMQSLRDKANVPAAINNLVDAFKNQKIIVNPTPVNVEVNPTPVNIESQAPADRKNITRIVPRRDANGYAEYYDIEYED